MSELTSLTIAEARDKMAQKEITALELTDAYLAAIEASNENLNKIGRASCRERV